MGRKGERKRDKKKESACARERASRERSENRRWQTAKQRKKSDRIEMHTKTNKMYIK